MTYDTGLLKAFASVSKQYMIEALKEFKFHSEFIKWVEVLTSKTKSCISNYGHLTSWFPLQRGLRQGCPLSAMLFIVCIELMAIQIRQSENVHGITLFGCENQIKISQYADDNTIFVKDRQSVQAVLWHWRGVTHRQPFPMPHSAHLPEVS